MNVKKIFIVSSAILCLTSVTSCDTINKVIKDNAVTINPEPTETTVGEKDNETIYIWTDEETGVQYVIYREKCAYAGFGGITPCLNPDGSLYITETDTDTK